MQSENNKDPLFSNKIAAAVLAALLLVFGLPQLTAAVFGGGHHGGEGEELHLAYCCVELEGGDASAEAEAEAPPDLGTLLASASATGGERRAALCKSCHTFEQGGANGAGPNLWNVVGRDVASVSGFSYTSALQGFGGAWTYERLDEYLRNSQEYVPGTSMVQRFARDDQRADILAYLQTLSANPVSFPEPAPVAEEVGEATEEASGPIEDVVDAVEEAAEGVVETVEEIVNGDDDSAESVED